MQKPPVDDGEHRRIRADHGYVEYSRTGSGGTIFTNPAAPPEARWLIEHPAFGNKFFANHEDILLWTVEQMRIQFKQRYG